MKKLGLIFVVLLCFGLFLLPNKSFALNNADVARWKGYADTAFGDPAYAMYKEVFYKLADEVFLKYPNVDAKTGFQYILQKGPEMDPVRYGSAYISGMISLTEDEQRSNMNSATAPARLRADNVMSALLSYKNIEDATVDVNNKTITEAQAKEKIENAVANHQKSVAATDKASTGTCKTFDIWCHVQESLVNFIKIFLLNIAGFLLWVSANMLNYSIKVGILDFARWAPDTLYPIWIVVRQIVSLFVVFAGLYLGLMYIIGKDEKFEKYIPWVVIFALFVNFSYPLARTAIDISNVVSLNIYTGAVGTSVLTGDQKNTAGAIIMQRLGLEKLVTSATENKANTDMITGISSPAGAFMAIIFVLFSAYIFFMVTWLIIARTAVLIFLTIASPILFVDSVIPKLGDVAMKLRKMFVEQLFVGPVFMIMLALTLKFLEVFNLSRSPSSGVSGTSDATIVEFFNITMMLIMLHIMRKVTMSTAGSIGETVSGYMGKVGGFATRGAAGGAAGLAMGGAGFLARGTMGRAAAAVRDSKWVTNNQNGILGRHAYNMTNSIAKSSFDARNSSYVQTGAKKLGLGIGMGANTNYEKSVDARVQDRKERYARIKTENPDGTTDQAGAEAKRRFHENAGGSLFNKKEIKKELTENDLESAVQENKKFDADASLAANAGKILTGKEKQDFFYKENSTVQSKMIESDREIAEKMNEKIDDNKLKREQLIEALKNKQANSPTQNSNPSPNNQQPVNDLASIL